MQNIESVFWRLCIDEDDGSDDEECICDVDVDMFRHHYWTSTEEEEEKDPPRISYERFSPRSTMITLLLRL